MPFSIKKLTQNYRSSSVPSKKKQAKGRRGGGDETCSTSDHHQQQHHPQRSASEDDHLRSLHQQQQQRHAHQLSQQQHQQLVLQHLEQQAILHHQQQQQALQQQQAVYERNQGRGVQFNLRDKLLASDGSGKRGVVLSSSRSMDGQELRRCSIGPSSGPVSFPASGATAAAGGGDRTGILVNSSASYVSGHGTLPIRFSRGTVTAFSPSGATIRSSSVDVVPGMRSVNAQTTVTSSSYATGQQYYVTTTDAKGSSVALPLKTMTLMRQASLPDAVLHQQMQSSKVYPATGTAALSAAKSASTSSESQAGQTNSSSSSQCTIRSGSQTLRLNLRSATAPSAHPVFRRQDSVSGPHPSSILRKMGSSKYSNENLSKNVSYEAEDPGIMSEVETSATGAGSSNFKRSTRLRSSLPIVRTASKTADRSLGLVFLQHRNETKRALLPNEITTLDTVKALFVRSFPRQLNMNYLDSRNVRIYIHDAGKDMFYELEDLRDVRDRSVLRIYEQDLENGTWQPVGGLRPEHPRVLNERMNQEILAARNQAAASGRMLPGLSAAAATGPASGPVSGNWMDDPSYFSEPEFESASDFQDHHIHRSRKERASFGAGGGGGAAAAAASVSSPIHHQSQSQYYGTIIIPAYRTAAMMQQQQQQQNTMQPQAAVRQSLDRAAAAKAFPGYAQTLPRNISMANATYGNLAAASPIKGSPTVQQQQQMLHQQQQMNQMQQQQQQQDRSVSPDLVSKRQHKDQMVMVSSGPGAPPKPQRSFSTLVGGQQRSPGPNGHAGIFSPVSRSPMSPSHSAFRPLPDRPYSVAGQFAPSNGPVPDRRSFPEYTGYLSSPERRMQSGEVVHNSYPGSGFENELYGYAGSRPSSVAGVVDDVARIKMENMERQLMNLTGLVQAALVQPNAQQTTSSAQSDMKDKSKPAPPPKPFPYGMSRSATDGASSVCIMPITAEVVHQLRSLRFKTRGLREEFHSLRKMASTQSRTTRDVLRETCEAIQSSLSFLNTNDPMERKLRLDRLRLSRDEEGYRHDMRKLEKDLTNLESQVEELRSNVINRRCKVNMSDVESMAHVLSRSSKIVADLKLRYPHLQDSLKTVMQQEMEIVVREEKFLKEEPEKLDTALRRCKKLTGTLVTLKRLASVQEQRSSSTGSPQGQQAEKASSSFRNEDDFGARSITLDGSSHTVIQVTPATPTQKTDPRAENALDSLLDELQTFSKPSPGGPSSSSPSCGGSASMAAVPKKPVPPPRSSSRINEQAQQLMLLSSLTAAALQSARRSNATSAATAAAAGGSGAAVMRSNSIPASASDIHAVLRPKSTPPSNLSLIDQALDAVLQGSLDGTPSESSSSIDSQNGALLDGLVNRSSRQQVLEDRHQELLRKQRLLQDQYTKLQMLSRGHIPEDLLHDLKKTGSESNIMSKSAIGANASGSLSQLVPNLKNRPFATLQHPSAAGLRSNPKADVAITSATNGSSSPKPFTLQEVNGFQKSSSGTSQLSSTTAAKSSSTINNQSGNCCNNSSSIGSGKHVETQKIYETDIL